MITQIVLPQVGLDRSHPQRVCKFARPCKPTENNVGPLTSFHQGPTNLRNLHLCPNRKVRSLCLPLPQGAQICAPFSSFVLVWIDEGRCPTDRQRKRPWLVRAADIHRNHSDMRCGPCPPASSARRWRWRSCAGHPRSANDRRIPRMSLPLTSAASCATKTRSLRRGGHRTSGRDAQ